MITSVVQTREITNGDEAKRVEQVDADARCYWLFRYRAVVQWCGGVAACPSRSRINWDACDRMKGRAK